MTYRKSHWFLSRFELEEEMEEFFEEWDKERGHTGDYVPARLLLQNNFTIRELLERGLIETNGFGYAPAIQN